MKLVNLNIAPNMRRAATMLFGVDYFPDVYERIARTPGLAMFLGFIVRRRIRREMFEAPLLFIHVPKNAGTSIKRILYRADPGHSSVCYYQAAVPKLLDRATTFAILRDPVDRFLSSFNFALNKGGNDVPMSPGPLKRLGNIQTVDDYLDYLERARGNWFKVDNTARPQWWFLVDRRSVVRIKNIFLLNAKDGKLLSLLNKANISKIPRNNETKKMVNLLSEEQFSRMKRLYSDDFALYEFVGRANEDPESAYGLSMSDIRRRNQ